MKVHRGARHRVGLHKAYLKAYPREIFINFGGLVRVHRWKGLLKHSIKWQCHGDLVRIVTYSGVLFCKFVIFHDFFHIELEVFVGADDFKVIIFCWKIPWFAKEVKLIVFDHNQFLNKSSSATDEI